MKIAVGTPFHKTPTTWLEQCLASVAGQTVPCTHFLVCDGDEPPATVFRPDVQVLRLPQAHRDFGGVPRAIGSASAIGLGFQAIAYLDADNWYEPEHLQLLWTAHERTGAAVCTCDRTLYDLQGQILGRCPEVNGNSFADTNCLFLTHKAFCMVAVWYLLPRSKVEVGDRLVWNAIKNAKLKRAHVNQATVNYRTRHRSHYRHFGKEPPPQAKEIKIHRSLARSSKLAVPSTLYRLENRVSSEVLTDQSGEKSQQEEICQDTAIIEVGITRSPSLDQGPPVTVSLCMIVRDEERSLESCLRSAADLVNDMNVVDTGSTDRTKEIAAACGAKVFDFPWVDDFAAARNESLRHANGEWILWLDADESFDEKNRALLKRLLGMLRQENRAYMMKQYSLPARDTGSALAVDHARLFRNRPGVCWRYRVHEQILPSLREAGDQAVFTDIVLQHTGYQEQPARQRKLNRNHRLLQMEYHDRPNEAFTLFNLGATCRDLGDPAQAALWLEKCVATARHGATFLPKAYVVLAQIQRSLDRVEEGLRWCAEGKVRFPEDPELWFEEGLLHKIKEDWAEAQRCFQEVLRLPLRPCFVAVNVGIRGYLTRHQLALIHRKCGRPNEAEAHWRAATKESPRFGRAWLGLAEICLEQGRTSEVEQMVAQLSHTPDAEPVISVLRSRLCLTQSG